MLSHLSFIKAGKTTQNFVRITVVLVETRSCIFDVFSVWSIHFSFTENTVKYSVLVHLSSFSLEFVRSEPQYNINFFFFLLSCICYSLAHFFQRIWSYLHSIILCSMAGFVLPYLFLLANETSLYLIPMLPPLSVYSW